MAPVARLTRALAATLLLGACAAVAPEPGPAAAAPPRPAALRLSLTGKAAAVFGPATAVPVLLARAGAGAPVALEFVPGALTRFDLPPGDYAVARIGPLACDGIGFTLTPGPEPRALGTLEAELLRTDYDIALVSARPAGAAELAELGPGAQAAPLFLGRRALCHSASEPGTGFRDLSPAEQVLTGLLFAGFCAAALATGGFCAF